MKKKATNKVPQKKVTTVKMNQMTFNEKMGAVLEFMHRLQPYTGSIYILQFNSLWQSPVGHGPECKTCATIVDPNATHTKILVSGVGKDPEKALDDCMLKLEDRFKKLRRLKLPW